MGVLGPIGGPRLWLIGVSVLLAIEELLVVTCAGSGGAILLILMFSLDDVAFSDSDVGCSLNAKIGSKVEMEF